MIRLLILHQYYNCSAITLLVALFTRCLQIRSLYTGFLAMLYKRLLIPLLTSLVFLYSCTNYNPQIGMSFQEWDFAARMASKDAPEMVGQKARQKVYYLPNSDQADHFYWFENNQLIRISKGDLTSTRSELYQQQ